MEIIGMAFNDSSKWDIIKEDNVLYCGEYLFIYKNFNQAKKYVKMIKLDDLPSLSIVKIYDNRIQR